MALQDAGLLQRKEAVHEHLRAAVKPDREWVELRPLRKRRAKLVEKAAEGGVVRVTQNQGMRQRIRERADPDLKRSSVFHQGGRMQRHGVVGQRHRLLGWSKQSIVRICGLQHHVDLCALDLRLARHVREILVELDGEHRRLVSASRDDTGQHIERNVGIGAQAHTWSARMRRDELGKHIRLDSLEVPRHLGIVDADVALLCQLVRQELTGQQKEFVDPDVCRQPSLSDRRRIKRLDTAGEEAAEKRLSEPSLQRRPGRAASGP